MELTIRLLQACDTGEPFEVTSDTSLDASASLFYLGILTLASGGLVFDGSPVHVAVRIPNGATRAQWFVRLFVDLHYGTAGTIARFLALSS